MRCALCKGERWVCEFHLDKAWPVECDCGAGTPCECNPEAADPPGFVTIATIDPESVETWAH